MADQYIDLTREELYKRIWSKPTVSLAEELGISDVALGKICRRMAVPKPPIGYWRKIETGHKTEVPPLTPPGETTLLSVSIYPHFESDQLALQNPQVQERLAAEQLPENKI